MERKASPPVCGFVPYRQCAGDRMFKLQGAGRGDQHPRRVAQYFAGAAKLAIPRPSILEQVTAVRVPHVSQTAYITECGVSSASAHRDNVRRGNDHEEQETYEQSPPSCFWKGEPQGQ